MNVAAAWMRMAAGVNIALSGEAQNVLLPNVDLRILTKCLHLRYFYLS